MVIVDYAMCNSGGLSLSVVVAGGEGVVIMCNALWWSTLAKGRIRHSEKHTNSCPSRTSTKADVVIFWVISGWSLCGAGCSRKVCEGDPHENRMNS